jgi:hypothetical protein
VSSRHRTNTAELAAQRPRRQAERPAGAPEPDDPGNHYKVDPGDGHPEYWAALPPGAGIRNADTATARARMLSGSGPPQRVIRVTDGTPKVIRRYQNGREIGPVRTGDST